MFKLRLNLNLDVFFYGGSETGEDLRHNVIVVFIVVLRNAYECK